MVKTNYVFKGLGFSYILTMAIVLVYSILLKYTSLGADTVDVVASFITTISAAFGGFYASKKLKEKGLMYGLIVGFMYIFCITLTVFLVKENFTLEIQMLYKIVLMSIAGGIGGVLGVNFK